MPHEASHLPEPILAIVGPTASGKARIGRAVAQKIGAEIVSLDSMKIYRGMDVGTAKPSEAARREVTHHLLDVVAPNEPYSVARYLDDAMRVGARIESRGRQALFVGGTPLYLKALLDGLLQTQEPDLAFRERLRQEAEAAGGTALWERLRRVDPASAQRIHAHDQRRLIRALEYHQTTGSPISAVQTQWHAARRDARLVGIRWPREILIRRIGERVERMFANGLVDEVQRIVATTGFGRVARQALGYKELLETASPDEAKEAIRQRTRRLAKRQMTWLRRFDEIRWVDIRSEDEWERAIMETAEFLSE